MATTHYSELKVFALSTPGVENASCEFNVETLKPTYRLLIGVPGKSNAFAISKKLGLPDYIIEEAKTHLEAKDESFEDLLTSLEESRLTIEKEQAEPEEEQIFKGKTFVITGSLSHFSNRKELQELIESKGGKAAGSVSAKTSYLINNDVTSSSSKNKKARELGIPILSEEDFLRLLEGNQEEGRTAKDAD